MIASTTEAKSKSLSQSSGDEGLNSRLETLLKNLPGMAYRCLNDSHWPMQFVSNGCFELCGYHRHELESQAVLWGDFTHPDEIDFVDNTVRTAAHKGRPFEVEYRIITRDGIEKWVWERGRVVDVRDDGMAILEGFITDITDRKLAETALKNAEAFAQAVVQSAVEAVITLDSQFSVESFNLAAQNMFGYLGSEVRKNHCRILIAPNHYREFELLLKQCNYLKNPTGFQTDFNARRNNGEIFPIQLSINEIHNELEKKFVLLIRDLSRQRAAEKEAREQRDLLAHVDRLNTLGEMAAGMAHEINQPLSAISMYAQTGLRYLDKNSDHSHKLHEVLEKISTQAHRAGAVIERMQEMTRSQPSRRKLTNCRIMIEEVYKLAEVDARIKNYIIALRIAADLPEVSCDRIQIQQVILNLLRNGMESMKSSGSKSGSKVVLSAEPVSQGVKIAIIDSGAGISMKMAKQLFQPFTSTKESGMGLGLTISQSIISAHGGIIEFENNKPSGATFYFSLNNQQVDDENQSA